jgi:Bacterial extracellular solute-binding proteins, family 5 Middle
LPDPVELSHALQPTNDSERLLFRHLFEPLVRLDCQSELRPGLAQTWSSDSGGRIWTFTLRSSARFPDGSALNASGLVAGWRTRWTELQVLGLDSVTAPDEYILRAWVQSPPAALPPLFASPLLSAVPSKPPALAAHERLAFHAGPRLPVVLFVPLFGRDIRDALDVGIDLVITRDPAVIEYASGQPSLNVVPLPWDRTYALVQRLSTGLEAGLSSPSVRRSLASEAVQADARPSESSRWWNDPCVRSGTPLSSGVPAQRIVYPRNDEVARQLAERVVALTADSAQLRVAGLDPEEFGAALGTGRDRGYIVPLPFRPATICGESVAWSGEDRVDPLIDTRARAIVRQGSPTLTIDWDGVVRLARNEDQIQGNHR